MVLVESRHSLLAAVGMGVVVAVMAKHFPRSGASLIVILLLSSQGLALRQAEVSQLQASVHRALYERSGEIRAAPFVVIDIASLADRVSYTWGQRTSNVLRAYWGLHAFAAGGLDAMVNDSLYDKPQPKPPRVAVCAGGLSISEGGGTLRAELHEREALHSSSIGDVAD